MATKATASLGLEDRLRGVPMFSDCSPAELRTVGAHSLVLRYPPGGVVVAEGEPGAEAFVILEGEARVSVRGEDLASLGPGELFGEMAVLSNRPRTATVTATSPLELLVLDPDGLTSLLGQNTIAWKALQSLAERLRSAQEPPTWRAAETDHVVAYPLGAEQSERQRLLTQAEVWEPYARWLLDQIDLPLGGKAIDVACGPLGILHVLAERVGPSGEVLGLDREARMLALGREVVAERDLTCVRLIEADAADTGLPRDNFDLVHCRTLLINVTNPEPIVAEMAALTRPGGTVAVQEPDATYWVCDPPHPAWDRLHQAVIMVYGQQGRTIDIGRRLGRLLRDAGLADVRTHAHAFITAPDDVYQTLLLSIVDAVRPLILDAGLYDEPTLDAIISSARAHLEQPGTAATLLIWQAWGTRH